MKCSGRDLQVFCGSELIAKYFAFKFLLLRMFYYRVCCIIEHSFILFDLKLSSPPWWNIYLITRKGKCNSDYMMILRSWLLGSMYLGRDWVLKGNKAFLSGPSVLPSICRRKFWIVTFKVFVICLQMQNQKDTFAKTQSCVWLSFWFGFSFLGERKYTFLYSEW